MYAGHMYPLEEFNNTPPPPYSQQQKQTSNNSTPVVECHGRKWYNMSEVDQEGHFRPMHFRQWYLYDNFGNNIVPGEQLGRDLSCLDALHVMFPINQLKLMVRLTNNELDRSRKKKVTEGESLKFLGILFLMNRVCCRNHCDLWRYATYKQQQDFKFNDTRMGRHRW